MDDFVGDSWGFEKETCSMARFGLPNAFQNISPCLVKNYSYCDS